MNSSDIFVLPSLTEGLPNVVLEAMAAGKPIISTDVGCVKDFIRNNQNGLLVPSDNVSALKNAMQTLIENENLQKKFSKRVKQDIKYNTWDSIAKKLEKMYLDLIL